MMQHIFGGSPFFLLEVSSAWRLIAAALFGAVIGLQRSVAGKHAGMRTYALVALGSALFTICGTLASYELSLFSSINPLQIAGSIVIGIGFIGSGLAAFRGDHLELTTAAGVWVAAGVGMAAGYGLYVIAITTTVLSLLIFTIFTRFERGIQGKFGHQMPDLNGQ